MSSPSPASFGTLIPGATEGCAAASPASPCCVVVSDPNEVERLRPAWTALLEQSDRNELTQSPDWLLTWWRVYGSLQGRRLRLGIFHDANRLIGLAPLLRRRHWYHGGLPFRRLELLASGEPTEYGIYSNHLGVLAKRGSEEQVAGRLVRAITEGAFGTWDEVVLPMMSGDTRLPGLLVDAFRAAGVHTELMETARAPFVSLPATWEAYLQSLSANGRRNIHRSLKAWVAWTGGPPQVEAVTDLANLEIGKKVLVHLHHARWASLGQTGVFRSPFYLQFHNTIMDGLVQRGSLELLWLRAHGEPVAVLYGMVWAGKTYAYQMGRRTDLPGHLRPGAVLLALAIRRAIEAGRREFDLLADEAFYKHQLASQSRPLVQVRAARSCLAEEVRRRAKAILGKMVRKWMK